MWKEMKKAGTAYVARATHEGETLSAWMLFVFGGSRILRFWMKDMEFALDVLWIKDNKIIGISKNVLPPSEAGKTLTMQSPAHVDKALELNAGTIDRYDIKVGDTIVIQEN